MGINLTDFTTRPIPDWNDKASDVIDSIKRSSSSDEFKELCEKNPNYKLNIAGSGGWTALHRAVLNGNLDVIDHIISLRDKSLFTLALDTNGPTPLHLSCTHKDTATGLSMVEKLLPWTPVNIVKKTGGPTPLEKALIYKKIEIATLLLRHGGIARREQMQKESYETLESAKKEIMTDNEKLFKLGLEKKLPKDIMNSILSFSARLF